MRTLLATVLLAGLLVSLGGCRFLSSDEEGDALYFDITIEDVEIVGSGGATLDDQTLVIRGEYLQPDSSIRYVELTVADFTGERTYALGRSDGIYGEMDGDAPEQYGYSSGRPEDGVRIDDYDGDDGVLVGAFFFYGTAFRDFDEVRAFYPFRIAGRFRTRLE